MREIRDPGHSVPDTVPEELVAVYGERARGEVRYRRSRRYRLRRRIGGWIYGRDPLFLLMGAGMWTIVVAALTATAVILSLR